MMDLSFFSKCSGSISVDNFFLSQHSGLAVDSKLDLFWEGFCIPKLYNLIFLYIFRYYTICPYLYCHNTVMISSTFLEIATKNVLLTNFRHDRRRSPRWNWMEIDWPFGQRNKEGSETHLSPWNSLAPCLLKRNQPSIGAMEIFGFVSRFHRD